MKRSFADILQNLDDGRLHKLAHKLPAWAAAGAELPSALALEQCSSEATARYKAGLLTDTATPDLVLDLTGGLGVDSWAFAQVAERLVYYERDAELAAAAARNFARLGVTNIEVRCEAVTPQTKLPEADFIYADPARRDAAGRKVFLLEDCSPDILTLLPMLLEKAPLVLLKLSPMADLSLLTEQLGPALQGIHIVESEGEVKELLCLLRGRDDRPETRTGFAGTSCGQGKGPRSAAETPAGRIPLPGISGFRLPSSLQEERDATLRLAAAVRPGDTLLEPCPALLKAGAFKLPCARWGLRKLAVSTHLYLAPETGLPPEAAPFFKARPVRNVLPFGKAAFRELKARYPQAEVTARNLPLRSEALRSKMGISPGGDAHIFGCRLENGSAILIVT